MPSQPGRIIKCCFGSLLLVFILLWSALADAKTHKPKPVTKLCQGFKIIGELKPSLSDVEKRLVCGDAEGNKVQPNDAWKTIPYAQAKFNLTNFLQERGYHHPVFRSLNEDHTEVEVEVGKVTRASMIFVIGTDAPVEVERMRKVIGEPLTPLLLGLVEKWVFDRLRELGYGCPNVETEADPDTGMIHVNVKAGSWQYIASITEESIPGIEDGTLQRYNAFQVGDRFDGNLLVISENRVISSQIVQSARFTTQCDAQGVHLKQDLVVGPPRLLTVGFGVNTEGLTVGRVSWRNTRLSRFGSLIDVSAFVSIRQQRFQSTVNWYVFPHASRYYLSPQFQVTHLNQPQFENVSASAQFGLASTYEFKRFQISAFLGPTLTFFRTISGIGAPTTRLLSLEGRMNLQDHVYERFLSSPRAGYNYSLTVDLNDKSIVSSVTAQRLNFRGEWLWNLKNFDPPLWVFGVRYGYSTVFTSESQRTNLPANFLQYLGGSLTLRGFGWMELPVVNGGGLTSAFLGLESRLCQTLPFDVDPFFFLDFGEISNFEGSLSAPLYWNPGFGLRWASPIGPVRTTLAHGFVGKSPDHLQFFISLGEEF